MQKSSILPQVVKEPQDMILLESVNCSVTLQQPDVGYNIFLFWGTRSRRYGWSVYRFESACTGQPCCTIIYTEEEVHALDVLYISFRQNKILAKNIEIVLAIVLFSTSFHSYWDVCGVNCSLWYPRTDCISPHT